MDLGLKDKVALVTASSKGLGRACAEALAAEGAKVVICARNKLSLDKTAEEIRAAHGVEVLAIPTDVSNSADIDTLIQQTLDTFGAIHVLVVNAGGPPAGYFMEFDDDAWQDALNLTLMSAVRLTRAVIPTMKEQQWGRIINITSLSVKEPIDPLILSNAVRPAVHGMAKTLSNQLARDGITINNVMPGYIRTDRTEQLARHRSAETGQTVDEIIDGMGDPVPAGRVGQPAEFAAMVAFLASEQASYVTGASIPVDGGRIAGTF